MTTLSATTVVRPSTGAAGRSTGVVASAGRWIWNWLEAVGRARGQRELRLVADRIRATDPDLARDLFGGPVA